MKVRSSVKKICVKCKIVRRQGVVFVICANQKHSRDRGAHMARIAGVDLPRGKRVEIALTYIYGIGTSRSNVVLGKAGIDPSVRVKDLSEEEASRIAKIIDGEGGVEGDLRKDVAMNIKRLMEVGSYRGMRHRRNLPTRGQRTHTNARTRKGPRRAMIRAKKTT